MDDSAQQTPPIPHLADSSIPLPNRHAEHAPKFATVAIGFQASKQNANSPTQGHHSPLCPESPYIYSDNGSICIENQAPIPVSKCIITNEPANQTVRIALRDPKNSSTWWGKRPHLTVGLTNSVAKKIRQGVMMTWATIGLGIASIASGVIANLIEINPIFALSCYWFGALLVLFAGFFRANASISAPVVGRSFTTITGAHPEYLE
ncbi:hypothetical protein N8813_05575 [bacterium]|nr:hypothetical protein [bacterium]MDA7673012.1 hypothetical protein [Verrucomicrobiales bacterium]MDC0258845.1 hypothetical protein [Verrucomicrobiales bacterium]